MSMLNTEKPMVIMVTHSRAVFQNTFPFFMVWERPQKQAAMSTAMKKAAPLLNGSPNTFTKSRSA